MEQTIINLIRMALKEDIPEKDISSEYLFTDEISNGQFIAKEDGVISGIEVCKQVFLEVDNSIDFQILKLDGSSVQIGDIIARVSGKTKSLLKAERVGLNFLQRMSGVATMTNKFVNELAGFETKILDTRKTTPLLRTLEKQAVVDGGGVNHRFSLSDMVMLKDNHLKAAKSISHAVAQVRTAVGKAIKIEVEVESVEQFKEALTTDCDIIMLDNMSLELMRECVLINQKQKKLEASGNMSLSRVKEVAQTGVDFISVGGLTHSYRSLDISLKF